LSQNDCVVNKSLNVLNTSSTNQISDPNVNNDSSLLVDTDVTDIGNVSDLFTTQSFSDNSRLSISILLGILLKSK
jgi:hypothetical protein